MIVRLPNLIAGSMLVAVLALPGITANKSKDVTGKDATAQASTTVTGCLTKGDEANEYAIKADDGKTYGLYSSAKINLADHVGHKVTVMGHATHEKTSKATTKTGMPEESAHLRVSKLQMVSAKCP